MADPGGSTRKGLPVRTTTRRSPTRSPSAPVDFGAVFADHRELLWGLCYRMTGSAADAEDLVQDTFRRAMERPPVDTDRPWRPWLVRVATRLSIDALRRRRVRAYDGPWLPEPVATDDGTAGLPADARTSDAEVRYGVLESATFAFLLALEALTPRQRAVLLLRDVMGWTGPEVAAALQASEGSVRITLHRARRTMTAYDGERTRVDATAAEATRAVMQRFMTALAMNDAEAMAACLCDDVVMLNDGGGVHHAARKPLHGADRVVKFTLGVSRRGGGQPRSVDFVTLNGLPALVVETNPRRPRDAPRLTVHLEVDASGRARRIFYVLAPPKLVHLFGAANDASA